MGGALTWFREKQMRTASATFLIESPSKALEGLGAGMTTREREVGKSHPASVWLRRDSNLQFFRAARFGGHL
jgi:hypothetical protein